MPEPTTNPSTEALRGELDRVEYHSSFRRTFITTICVLLVVAAIAVLITTLWLPVLQVTGSSMEPTLESGQIVIATKNADFKAGDVVAFYYDNKVLLKRVIGTSGDQVDIKDDGTVYVNGDALDEPYVSDKSLGECDVDFPYQVPDDRVFVMGDHRSTSIDSRTTSIGCVSDDLVVGKVVFRIWPLSGFGTVG